MAEQTNEFMTAAPTSGSEFALLETGVYSAVCVGLTKKEFKRYQHPDETEPKFQFVFQVADNGVNHYLRTLPMRNVISDKSNLFLCLNSWLGVSLEKASEGLDLGKCVGLKAQLVVDGQERDGKSYNVISNVLKAKKNDPVKFVADDAAPAFLNKGPFICSRWIEGLSFAEAEENNAEVTDDDLVKEAEQKKAASKVTKVDAKDFVNNTEEEDDASGLPF